jgi:hypothetical protein
VKNRLASVGLWLALDAETTWVARTKVSAESVCLPTRAAEADLGKSVRSSRCGSEMTDRSSTNTTSSAESEKAFAISERLEETWTRMMFFESLI